MPHEGDGHEVRATEQKVIQRRLSWNDNRLINPFDAWLLLHGALRKQVFLHACAQCERHFIEFLRCAVWEVRQRCQ